MLKDPLLVSFRNRVKRKRCTPINLLGMAMDKMNYTRPLGAAQK